MPRESFASSPEVRLRWQKQPSKNTGPELALRKALHARGLRYFVHRRPLPKLRREADVVFPARRVAVFVDGCFFHCCPEHGTQPKTNDWYWAPKLARNVERDRETDAALAEAGWTVIRIWEHERADSAADRIEAVVRAADRHRRQRAALSTSSAARSGGRRSKDPRTRRAAAANDGSSTT